MSWRPFNRLKRDNMGRSSFDLLPTEMAVKVFSYVPALELHSNLPRVCSKWRNLVSHNLPSLPKMRTHVRVWILDVDDDVSFEYQFSFSDPAHPNYDLLREKCVDGGTNCKRLMLGVGACDGIREAYTAGPRIKKIKHETAYDMLAKLEVETMRVETSKDGKGRKRSSDEHFYNCVRWCEENCGGVLIGNVVMSSTGNCEWKLGPDSMRTLSLLPLSSLTMESMPSCPIFAPSALPTAPSLNLHMDKIQRSALPDVKYIEASWELLSSLVSPLADSPSSPRPPLNCNLFSDAGQIVTPLLARDILNFVDAWRSNPSARMVHSLTFNSLSSFSQLQSMASNSILAPFLIEIPYCRYRIFHKHQSGMSLLFAAYGNGYSTQWIFRSEKQESNAP